MVTGIVKDTKSQNDICQAIERARPLWRRRPAECGCQAQRRFKRQQEYAPESAFRLMLGPSKACTWQVSQIRKVALENSDQACSRDVRFTMR